MSLLSKYKWASLMAQLVDSACNAGDLGLILGLRRSPREGKGYSLQYSGLENPMNRGSRQGSFLDKSSSLGGL